MTNTIRIRENRKWVNADTGAEASVYGAAPYWGSDPGAWGIVTTGYTWEHVSATGNVTVGLCRVPAKTYEEAVDVAEKFAEATGANFIKGNAA